VRITVFGATGSVGRHVVQLAVAAGHEVHAYVRRPGIELEPAVSVTVGDLDDADAIATAVEGSDAVIWAVGASRNHPADVPVFMRGAQNLVAAMIALGVRRLVALSGAGITMAGEKKPFGGRVMSAIVGRLAKHVVEAKRLEYEVFSSSELDWTLARPPRVVVGESREFQAGSRLGGRSITNVALAAFLVAQLDDDTYTRSAPYVWSA
jgi:putative NADH-flavin reductase